MKVELQKINNIGTKRILRDLKNTLIELCEKESFEKITVQKLSKIGRAHV